MIIIVSVCLIIRTKVNVLCSTSTVVNDDDSDYTKLDERSMHDACLTLKMVNSHYADYVQQENTECSIINKGTIWYNACQKKRTIK